MCAVASKHTPRPAATIRAFSPRGRLRRAAAAQDAGAAGSAAAARRAGPHSAGRKRRAPDGRRRCRSLVGLAVGAGQQQGQSRPRLQPFFSDTHRFEPGVTAGSSSRTFYDPQQRAVAQLHADHACEKHRFDSWRSEVWDVNDTAALDPRLDADLAPFLARLPDAEYLPTWFEQRVGGALGPDEQTAAEADAALRAHARGGARRHTGPRVPVDFSQPSRARRRRRRGAPSHARRARRAGQLARPNRHDRPSDRALRPRSRWTGAARDGHGHRDALESARRGRQGHPLLGRTRADIPHAL